MTARGCICSYTWGPDGKPLRNGPMASCQALHPEDIAVTVNGGEPVPGEWRQVQYVPGLEERVAALEALLLPREPGWTPEQAEEFKADFERHLSEGPFDLRKYEPVRLLPPGPVLTSEVIEAALRECVTVVKPGETLVIRCRDWTPGQVEQYQEYIDAEWRELPFRVLMVIGDELGIVRPEPDADLSQAESVSAADVASAARATGGRIRSREVAAEFEGDEPGRRTTAEG